MNILITGAAGFLGSHLTSYIIKKYGNKANVFTIDNLIGGFKRNIDKKSEFYCVDLCDKDLLEKTIQKIKPDYIFHLAADATEGRSFFTPTSAIENNLNAYNNLLTNCLKVGFKKIIVCSSMSVYGSQTPPFNEDMDRKPVDIYAIAKTSMERMTEVMSDIYGFKYTILRPHNIYGSKQNIRDPYRNVLGIWLNRLLQKKPFYIYGNGHHKRSFTYVSDNIPMIEKAMFMESTNKEIINIGPLEEYSLNDAAITLLEAFGTDDISIDIHTGQIVRAKLQDGTDVTPIYLPPRPKEVPLAFCTKDKAEEILGYKTTISFKDGLKKFVDWGKKLGPQQPIYLDNLE